MRINVLIASLVYCITASAADFTLMSTAFHNNDLMPELYTCKGKDISPGLHWLNPPANTQSFALILDDPDAPAGTWYHWLVYNIPANTQVFAEGIQKFPAETVIGKNSWDKAQYNGPCPPYGSMHHYHFTLYALKTKLVLPVEIDGKTLVDEIQKHVIRETQLSVTYGR